MSRLDFLGDARPLTLAEIAACGQAVPQGNSDQMRSFRGAAALDRAGPDDLSAESGEADHSELAATRAGACFVTPEAAGHLPPHTIALQTPDPQAALGRVLVLMYPPGATPSLPFGRGSVDPAAVVHGEAIIEAGVAIAPGAVVAPRAEVGTGTTIGANAVVGPGVRIGRHCTIDTHASMQAALIGDRVTVHSGARIGPSGPGAAGQPNVPQLGRVIIQDDVEIGANAVIERGTLQDTTIGEGARIGPLTIIPSGATVDRYTVLKSSCISSPRKLV